MTLESPDTTPTRIRRNPSPSPKIPSIATLCLLGAASLQSCSKQYCEDYNGYQRASLDSLRLSGKLTSDSMLARLDLDSFSNSRVEWREGRDLNLPVMDRGSGGFATWIRHNPWHQIDLHYRTTGYLSFFVVIDSVNPYAADPHRGIVGAHLANSLFGEDSLGRLAGNIVSSIPMDAQIPEHQPFTFSISLRDTSGFFIRLTDSANLWTEFSDCTPEILMVF